MRAWWKAKSGSCTPVCWQLTNAQPWMQCWAVTVNRYKLIDCGQQQKNNHTNKRPKLTESVQWDEKDHEWMNNESVRMKGKSQIKSKANRHQLLFSGRCFPSDTPIHDSQCRKEHPATRRHVSGARGFLIVDLIGVHRSWQDRGQKTLVNPTYKNSST